jgi:putative ABC transport system permease protein
MNNIFNFKSYFNFLNRNKAYTLINVFGLSISLMFVILIGAYIQQEFGMDKTNSKADRIYVLGQSSKGDDCTGSHHDIQQKLMSRYPQIETTCAIVKDKLKVNTLSGGKMAATFLFTDSTFYRIFDFKLLKGNRNTVLNAPNNAVITKDFARKYFGNVDPIGKVLKNDSINFVVTGVAENMQNSCIRNIDVLTTFGNVKYANASLLGPGMGNAIGSDVFILARPHTDLLSKTEDMKRYFRTFFWVYQLKDLNKGVTLTPFNKLYFSPRKSVYGNFDSGDKKLVDILFTVGLVILLFAIMNYINLTVAQSGFRAKEMATRRLLGSQRSDIFLRLVMESIILCIISLVIGMLLAFTFAPITDNLLKTRLVMSHIFKSDDLFIIVAIILLMGVLAGIIPALVISTAKPIEVVRGTFRRKTRMVFSKVFITFQNILTIVMIASLITMVWQVHHLIHAPLGYNTKNIITVDNPCDSSKVGTFISELRRQPCVLNVSACGGTPFDRGLDNTMPYHGRTVDFRVFVADTSFMSIYGLKLVRDNHIDDENGVYVNKQALTEMGLDMKAKSLMYYNKPYKIRGIVNDFHLGDITMERNPVIIHIRKRIRWPWEFTVEVTGDPVEAYKHVRKVYKNVYGEVLDEDKPYIEQKIENVFESQIRISNILMLFTGIAVVISFLGLLAMSTYFIQQHNKEFAIRKVFGSSNNKIWRDLIRIFLSYVMIAFVIAVPIIYYFMNKWLSAYKCRIPLSPLIFIAAGLFCLIISFFTVFIQSYVASNANPADYLKEE